MATKIQHRGDTLVHWQSANPVLMDREVVLVATDPSKPNVYDSKKVGDGTHAFNDLPMLGYECLQGIGDSNVYPMSQLAVKNLLGMDDFETFSASKSYTQGSIVMYNGLVYEFITAHPAGDWNAAHVRNIGLFEIADQLDRTIDGGRADTKYGGLNTVDCGNANSWA